MSRLRSAALALLLVACAGERRIAAPDPQPPEEIDPAATGAWLTLRDVRDDPLFQGYAAVLPSDRVPVELRHAGGAAPGPRPNPADSLLALSVLELYRAALARDPSRKE